MYINYEEIKSNDVTIDVRTHEEFEAMQLFEHNVPVINKTQHNILKKHIYLAIPIIFIGLIPNRKAIKEKLHSLSHYRTYRLIIGCSQGRIRSPFVYMYARYLGIDAKVLRYGIKPHFIKKDYNTKNLFGFLDI